MTADTTAETTLIHGTNGRAYLADAKGKVLRRLTVEEENSYLANLVDAWDEGPTCSLCDGLGHGYPGGGPCPLEDRGWDDYEEPRSFFT